MQLINKRIELIFCILLFVASISFIRFVICSDFLFLCNSILQREGLQQWG
jgi:hypothetical protein